MESTYQKCGWNVQILTKSAVSTKEGIATFYSDNDLENLEWGGSIIGKLLNVPKIKYQTFFIFESFTDPHVEEQEEVKSPESVNLVHLSKFIQDIISSRKLPQLDPQVYGPPQVLMKLDIEGSEVEVIPDLILSESLQSIDVMMIEYHKPPYSVDLKRRKLSRVVQILLKSYVKFLAMREPPHTLTNLELDDESYALSTFALPQCRKEIICDIIV